jgi:hypothetical protein
MSGIESLTVSKRDEMKQPFCPFTFSSQDSNLSCIKEKCMFWGYPTNEIRDEPTCVFLRNWQTVKQFMNKN